jgi:hypothetical protein
MNPDEFKWRTETYEFVSDRLAIDLLAGSARYRELVEAAATWTTGGGVGGALREFARLRDEFLLYRGRVSKSQSLKVSKRLRHATLRL